MSEEDNKLSTFKPEEMEAGVQFPIMAYIDPTTFNAQWAFFRKRIGEIKLDWKIFKDGVSDFQDKLVRSIQSGLRVFYGMARFLGADMAQIFYALHGASTAAISTMKFLATATMSTPGGQIQGTLMMLQLTMALNSLAAVARGQTQIGRQYRGLTTSLRGISNIVGIWT